MLAVLLALVCGVEAWPQKILSDPGAAAALARPVHAATIAQLGALPRRTTRRPYAVTGFIVAIKTEADADLHVVIADQVGHTMIVEFPHPACAQGSKAYGAIVRARRQMGRLVEGDRIRVTGMLFMDRCHGQAGAAPNCVELHPVLDVRRAR
jgi:hypothetical protein